MELLAFVVLALVLIFYFLPAIIADIRGTEHQTAICLINLFLGWTVLGWIAALIWAVVEKPIEHKRVALESYVPIWQKKQQGRARRREEQAAALREPVDEKWDFPPR